MSSLFQQALQISTGKCRIIYPLICIGCGIKSHMVCSGQDIEYQIATLDEKKIVYYRCQKCISPPPKKKGNKASVITCVCCGNKDGLMKKVQGHNDKWAHIACALFSVNILEIVDYYKMEFKFKSIEENQKMEQEEEENKNENEVCSIQII
ncbi:hypothetical protein PPERSA_09901 [Pseudocohnilembus persalinus]|uniref:Uncharacterized protein n=1 Tax=Pseudocohnilembus persalinus TaxID=266149 RepID=A0A0V0QU74_PSEPJ|nr:hypothetical protein PPERSA_09901 [Pseudocohnilembus persalinus]|eukprot:KRX05761.1 hypothetical protein PPERSA_09901 [Pseudocohnilembus persalinus]